MKKMLLGEVASLERKTAQPIESAALPYIGLEHVESATGMLVEDYVPFPESVLASKFKFNRNHVLYGKLRPYLNKVVLPDFSGVCTTELLPLLPKEGKLDRRFLFALLMSPQFVEWASRAVAGANLPRLSPERLLEYEVNLPSLKEQEKFGEAIEKVMKARSLRRSAQTISKGLIPGVFTELFGDPISNEKGWDICLLSEVGSLDRGKSKNRPRNAPHLYNGPYPFVQTGDIANSCGYIREFKQTYSEAGLKQSKMWNRGTLCITIAANIAKTGILTFDSCFPDSVVGFTANDTVTPEFIQAWFGFMQKQLEDTAPESAQKNINLDILRNLKVPVPPKPLLNKFSEVVRIHEKARQQALEADRQLDHLFESMLWRAASGRLFEGDRAPVLSR